MAPRRVRIVSVEAVAEKLLLPRVPSFKVLLARHRHRARDRPSERRPGPARLRRLARLFGGDLRPAPANAARGHAPGGNPLRGGTPAGVRPGAHRRARLAPEPVRVAALAAALRSRLGIRPVLLVLPPGRVHADLSRASGFRLYSMLVQTATSGLGTAIGRPILIARELEPRDSGADLRPPESGARTLLPDHHRRLAATPGVAGFPGVDPARGAGRAAATAVNRAPCYLNPCLLPARLGVVTVTVVITLL